MRDVTIVGGVTHHVPQSCECHRCLQPCDAASSFNPNTPAPKPHDLCICAYCGAINLYGPDMMLANITDDELAALPPALREQLLSMSQAFQRSQINMARPDGPAITILVPELKHEP